MTVPNSSVLVRSTSIGWSQALRDYWILMKPGVMLLVLVTTAAAMWVALGEAPHPWTLFLTLLGTLMAGGAAGALNHVMDRDMDAAMPRTSHRPVASGRVQPWYAVLFSLVLGAASFILLYILVNPLSAYLALAGIVYYVAVYTAWLKRRTPQNIVIGGAAGAVGPLIGWAAASGQLHWAAVVMFLIVFFWTPPHFWALALVLRDQYAKARVPMLPVVAGPQATCAQIYGYSWVTVAVTLLMGLTDVLGWLYLAAAVLLGARLLQMAQRLLREPSDAVARALYGYSIVYLFGLFTAMVLDVTLLEPGGRTPVS